MTAPTTERAPTFAPEQTLVTAPTQIMPRQPGASSLASLPDEASLVRGACPNLTAALSLARDKCKAAALDKRVTFGNTSYPYASADGKLATGNAALEGSGLALIPVSEKLVVRGTGNMVYYALDRVWFLSHQSGEFVVLTTEGFPVIPTQGRPLDKAFAAAITTSLAYKVRDLLQMPSGEQHDLDARDDRTAAPPPNGPAVACPVTAAPVNDEQPPAPDPRTAARATVEAARTERYGPRHQPQPQPPEGVINDEQYRALEGIIGAKGRTPTDVETMLACISVNQLDQLPRSCVNWASSILTDGQVSQQQVDRISALIEGQGKDWDKVSARLHERYGVGRLRLLTVPQANEVEAALVKPKVTATAQTGTA